MLLGGQPFKRMELRAGAIDSTEGTVTVMGAGCQGGRSRWREQRCRVRCCKSPAISTHPTQA